MKKLTVFFLFVSTALVAQEKSGCMQLTEAQVLIGSNLSQVETMSLTDFKMLAPGSSILAKDYTGFSSNYYNSTYTNPLIYWPSWIHLQKQAQSLVAIGLGVQHTHLGYRLEFQV